MAEAFIGEVRILPYTFAPRDWANCDGQELPIAQNTTLFSIIGASYGGDGRSTMGVPDLKGRAAMSWGRAPGQSDYPYASFSGTPNIILAEAHMPAHDHLVNGTPTNGSSGSPQPTDKGGTHIAKDIGRGQNIRFLRDGEKVSSLNVALSPETLSSSGANAPVENRQPYLGVRFCICLEGTYPARN